jgi:DNA-3-methyladenine glycosylase
MQKLPFDFYNRYVVDVAKDLLGKTLYVGNAQGIITEVEAYRGLDDEASHAFNGLTPRASLMFGEPGISYIYLIYGMYHCLNIVTEAKGSPSAVLIRGLKLANIHLDGPGKICKYLGLNKSHNGINLVVDDQLYLTKGIDIGEYKTTSRIGIKKALAKQWRFVAE